MLKHHLICLAACLAVVVALPLTALPAEAPQSPQLPAQAPQEQPAEDTSIRLLLSETGEILSLPAREYVFGVVAAEISMNCHDEALKAQAVAAYTYALYTIARFPEQSYDLTDDPATHQAFITRAAAMEKWGDKAEENAARLDSITAQTQGLVLEYGGEPILAAYHDTSCGRTVAAAELWGGDYPYLVSVESAGDLLSPSFRRQKSFPAAEFAEICKSVGINLVGEASAWEISATRGPNGTTETLTVCSSSLSGADARRVFSLASAAFDVERGGEGEIIFTTRGNGHGVGMSQTGANYMALCGSTFAQILAWYYPGTALVQR